MNFPASWTHVFSVSRKIKLSPENGTGKAVLFFLLLLFVCLFGFFGLLFFFVFVCLFLCLNLERGKDNTGTLPHPFSVLMFLVTRTPPYSVPGRQ